MRATNRFGFTLPDLLIVVMTIGVLVALAMPVLGRMRGSSGEMVSMFNLMNIAAANAMYGADWDDRQFTIVPEDLGEFCTGMDASSCCTSYVAAGNCYPSPFVGKLANGADYYIAILPCPGSTGHAQCGGAIYTLPMTLTAFGGSAGHWRYQNLAAFTLYLDGRYYSPTWFAPKDHPLYEQVSKYFDDPAQMHSPPNPPYFSSYACSAASMWHPDLMKPLRPKGTAWNPNLLGRFASPTFSQALYPDLKTHLLEHSWLQNQRGADNPFIAGIQPYFFNHGLASTPITLFFDGHVSYLSIAQAVADDAAVMRQSRNGKGLWSRDTPLGPEGYFGEVSFDGTWTGVHTLTIGGITGRDMLTAP